jgi:two-component system, OmpR family, heavy metal sensor histidine kinase CusS
MISIWPMRRSTPRCVQHDGAEGNPPWTGCSHSISARLSKKLALFTIVVMGLLSCASWAAVSMLVKERNARDLSARSALFEDLLALEARSGGEAAVKARLEFDRAMRRASRLEVWRADGSLLHADVAGAAFAASQHLRSKEFMVQAEELTGGKLRVVYTVDYSDDAAMGTRWALVLLVVSLAAGAAVGGGVWWHVRRGLSPLRHLATQTRLISPKHLERRLSLRDPAEELLPWIEQFNALMQRLEQSYAQLEGFNADVAHELRTPLATLVGQTELALSRERSNESLRETLASNLEETQRLSAMVNDMLFLSHADRGAVARRGQPVSLAALAAQVIEFHEAPLEDAGLRLQVEGDVAVAVDEALFKRALSNLLGNATRFALRGSTVMIKIAPELPEQVQVVVQNTGEAIDAQSLPRLFDRFFRADASRCCDGQQHHGLGLAIVAAIARMHAGRTLAESQGGVTRVGFTLATTG